jgi:hypothetical protein
LSQGARQRLTPVSSHGRSARLGRPNVSVEELPCVPRKTHGKDLWLSCAPLKMHGKVYGYRAFLFDVCHPENTWQRRRLSCAWWKAHDKHFDARQSAVFP